VYYSNNNPKEETSALIVEKVVKLSVLSETTGSFILLLKLILFL
jgi:hypothetical protein